MAYEIHLLLLDVRRFVLGVHHLARSVCSVAYDVQIVNLDIYFLHLDVRRFALGVRHLT